MDTAETALPSPHFFDRSKPFYPIVLNYLCQLIGLTELAVRGIAGPRDPHEMVRSAIAREQSAGIHQSDPTVLRIQLPEISNSQSLRSEMLDRDIGVPFDQIAQELVANYSYIAPYFINAAARSLFVIAHEVSWGEPWRNNEPMWDFLFHCRNAVAHGGRFYFHNNQPRWPARWGRFELDVSLQGTPLFKKDGGMLSPGDPIRLLWDIEQTYPAMTA
jgi:hypothetical protein